MPMIIGITGKIGAGKGKIAAFLEKKGFKHLSVRHFLNEEILKRNLPQTRDSAIYVANELRKKSLTYLVEQVLAHTSLQNQNFTIESLRAPAEIEFLKNHGSDFHLIAVDADQKIRYERVSLRRGQFDSISFQKFIEDDVRESSSMDSSQPNIEACVKMADYFIENNNDEAELNKKIERILETIGNIK
jgi:dephospho-CoA kinase